MTEEGYIKAEAIRRSIRDMEAALKIVKSECRISAITKCTNVMGGVDFNLSANEDLDTTVRKGITTALEKRIAELKQEFEEL